MDCLKFCYLHGRFVCLKVFGPFSDLCVSVHVERYESPITSNVIHGRPKHEQLGKDVVTTVRRHWQSHI
jgi:hypothetical protein